MILPLMLTVTTSRFVQREAPNSGRVLDPLSFQCFSVREAPSVTGGLYQEFRLYHISFRRRAEHLGLLVRFRSLMSCPTWFYFFALDNTGEMCSKDMQAINSIASQACENMIARYECHFTNTLRQTGFACLPLPAYSSHSTFQPDLISLVPYRINRVPLELD